MELNATASIVVITVLSLDGLEVESFGATRIFSDQSAPLCSALAGQITFLVTMFQVLEFSSGPLASTPRRLGISSQVLNP